MLQVRWPRPHTLQGLGYICCDAPVPQNEGKRLRPQLPRHERRQLPLDH